MDIAKLVPKLKKDFPKFTFVPGTRASWSPKKQQISYNADRKDETAVWGLLHELGHAILEHTSYTTDIGLLRKEAAAWEKAESQAETYGFSIDDNYIQSCLETYRNWLYKRSACPQCGSQGIQKKEQQYSCLNCDALWKVSASRFCRPYRGSTKVISRSTKKSQETYPWLFVDNTISA